MESLTRKIKDIWFILVFVCTMAIWYANTNSRLNNVEAFQTKQDTLNQQIEELNTKVEVISTNIEFIKQRVK